MKNSKALVWLATVVVGATACTEGRQSTSGGEAMSGAPTAGDGAVESGAAAPVASPESFISDEGLRDVMQAKLVHAHLLVDAVVVQDFARIEQNARELAWLSQLAEWNVHETAEYGRLSLQFREICKALASEAHNGNAMAVRRRHEEMTVSCTECHAYLREAGLVPRLPGAISRTGVPH